MECDKLGKSDEKRPILRQCSVPLTHRETSQVEREHHQERAAALKRRLAEVGLRVMPSPSHIVPVMAGDRTLRKAACDELLQRHRIYVQRINHPTVPHPT